MDDRNEAEDENGPQKTLDAHKVEGVDDGLVVMAVDEAGPGGARHYYLIQRLDTGGDPLAEADVLDRVEIRFQKGPIQEVGRNGNASHEALAAILIDRLEGFQSGDFANEYNGIALRCFQAGLMALKLRTRERLGRGVEGQLKE